MQQFQDPPEKGGQAMHTSRYAELPYLQYERREIVLWQVQTQVQWNQLAAVLGTYLFGLSAQQQWCGDR